MGECDFAVYQYDKVMTVGKLLIQVEEMLKSQLFLASGMPRKQKLWPVESEHAYQLTNYL